MPPNAGAIRAGSAFIEFFVEDSRLIRGLRSAQRRLRNFGNSVRALGASFLKLGVVMATPFVLAARDFANFEQEMARVKALTGATAEEFKALETAAKNLGKTTVFSASQAAEAMSAFALAGFSVKRIMDAIAPTLSLAAAGQLEIGESAEIVAKIMNGMGIEAKDLGGVVDVLTKAFTSASTDLVQLGDALKFVGPIAKSAGISFKATVAALQSLSNAGIQAQMAGTGLRGILLAIVKDETIAKLAKFNTTVIDSAGELRPLADIVDDLNKSIGSLGKGDQLAILAKIFPAKQAASAAVLLAQGGDELRRLEAALDDEGIAARIAAIQLDTLTGSVKLLFSALEGLKIMIGTAINKPLRAAIGEIIKVVSVASDWVKNNKGLIVSLAKVTVGILSAGAALIGLATVLGLGSLILGALASGITFVASVLGAIVTGFSAVAFVLSFVLSPLGLIGVAIAGVIINFVKLTDTGKRASRSVTQAFKAMATEILTFGKTFLRPMVSAFNSLKTTADLVLGGVVDSLSSGKFALAAKIAALGIQKEFLNAFDLINRGWSEFRKDFLKSLFSMARSFSSFFIDKIRDSLKGLVEIAEIFSELVKDAADFTGLSKIIDIKVSGAGELRAAIDNISKGFKSESDVGKLGTEVDKELQRQFLQDIAKSEKALLDATKEFRRAISEAAKGKQFQQRLEGLLGPRSNDGPRSLIPFADQIRGGLDVAAGASSVAGTFNPAAISAFGGVDRTQDRIAVSAATTAKNTQKIADNTADFGISFAF